MSKVQRRTTKTYSGVVTKLFIDALDSNKLKSTNHNRTNSNSNLSKEPNKQLFYLVCPKCNTSIPYMEKYYIDFDSKTEIGVSFLCDKCNKGNSNTNNYLLNTFNSNLDINKINFVNFCHIHDTKPLSYYCIRCNSLICDKCYVEYHNHHKIQTHSEYYNSINLNLPFHSMEKFEKYSLEYLDRQSKYRNEITSKISRKILELNQIKVKVEEALETNIKINKNLINLVKLLYNNYLNSRKNVIILNNFSKLCQFNTSTFSTDDLSSSISSIEALSYSLMSYFDTNYIIHPYHIFQNNIYNYKGHRSGISALIQLKVNPKHYIISGSLDKTIKIWEIKSNYNCIATLEGHDRAINCLVELKNKNLCSASSDSMIFIWDLNTYQIISKLNSHRSFIFGLIELNDGRLISGSDDERIIIWKKNTYDILGSHNFGNGVFSLIEIKSFIERKRIAVGLGDCVIWLCYINNKYYDSFEKTSLKGHKGSVRTLLQLNDGRLVSGSNDNVIKIWDISDYKTNKCCCLYTINDHYLYINYLYQLNDGRIISCAFDDTIKIFNHISFKCLNTLTGHKSANAVIELEDGRVASGSSDSFLCLWY